MTPSRCLAVLLASVAAVAVAASLVWHDELPRRLAAAGLSVAGALLGIAVCAVLTTLHLLLRWLRWHYLIRRYAHGMGLKNSLLVYFSTLPALLTPLGVGELIRVLPLRRRHRSVIPCVVATWLIERGLDLAVLGALALWANGWTRPATVAAAAVAAALLLQRRISKMRPSRPMALFVPILLGVSVLQWWLPVLALSFVLALLGVPLSVPEAGSTVASGTLLGGLAGVPFGATAHGSGMASALELPVGPARAAVGAALFRVGTSWFLAALGTALLALLFRRLLALGRPSRSGDHFDGLADAYQSLIPEQVRERLLLRKTRMIGERLRNAGIPPGSRGLDIGCGQGRCAAELARAGFSMSAVDASRGQVEHAGRWLAEQGLAVEARHASATDLPFSDGSFDFAYMINVLHHIEGPEARRQAMAEVVRVLRPGGVFLLHEMNTSNPLFRFYLGYVFPLLCGIDDGTEEWILPTQLPGVEGQAWEERVAYFTFLPEFASPSLLRRLASLESALENSRWRGYSAHFLATLVRAAPVS